MFNCKACQARDRHISDLNVRLQQAHELFEKIVAPTYQPAVLRQADIALSGAGTYQEAEEKKLTPAEQQALALLTGTY